MKQTGSRMFDAGKVVALIPAYREARYIGDVVRRVKARIANVLVIDDGSPDATTPLAREAGAEVIIHPQNLGKGAAIKTGFNALLKREFEYVLILDGDGQHLPEEIDRFLTAAVEAPAEIYIGNRMEDVARMPWVRRLANRFMSWQISRLCGHHVPDTQCGFRMIRRELIPGLFCESNAFDYETEMLLIAGQAGHRIISIPITTIYGSEVSKINPIQDGIRFFKLLARY